MQTPNRTAPGGPGIPARWTSSAKTGVGTALSNKSHVWFTLSHGIFNEIYYPRIDQACVRDMGLIVTDGADFFSEEKREAGHKVERLADGMPAFRLVNTCHDGRYRIEKQIVTDPHRDTVLQQVHFVAQKGALSNYHLHVLLAPHLGNQGAGNTAWVGEFEGAPLLFAQRKDNALALACSAPWSKRSVGYVGSSDGYPLPPKHDGSPTISSGWKARGKRPNWCARFAPAFPRRTSTSSLAAICSTWVSAGLSTTSRLSTTAFWGPRSTARAVPVGKTTTVLTPNPAFAAFDAMLDAVNYSNNVGRNGPVCIYSTGQTWLGADKRLWLDATGLHAHSARTAADAQTTITNIVSIKGRKMVEKIAWRRACQQLGEAQAIASQHAAARLAVRVDAQADPRSRTPICSMKPRYANPWTSAARFPKS